MSATAFRTGQDFKFPKDENIYQFARIEFDNGKPHVYYWDGGIEKLVVGFWLSDLIKVQ